MRWVKKGLIFKVDNDHDWMRTHAQVPTADLIEDNVLRIYFGTRDGNNRTLPTYLEVEANNPQKILYVHDKPILSLGKIGNFDDSGVMPSWLVSQGNKKLFYYIGWNVGSTVPYRIANGLAISEDYGQTFNKISDGPIMDRTIIDPISVSTQCVVIDGDIWKTWYMSFTAWQIVNGVAEPSYHIKYAESKDGISWIAKGDVCIDCKVPDECGIARPCVIKEGGLYKMWHSYRGIDSYRTDRKQSYRIGYAESGDGIHWTRKDEAVGIDISDSGWDSEMIAYPFVYEHKGKKYMLYNGNGFGKSGIGYAMIED